MLEELTITQFHRGIIEKRFSILEIVTDALSRIKKENESLHAFLSVFSDEAKQKARELDAGFDMHRASVLYGVPMAIKDNMLISGTRTTAGSRTLQEYIAPYTATAVQKLIDAEAVILGKTNLDEFAMGSSTEFSAFGVTKNPYDETRVAGGSSGGSAAAVAAHMALGALGSDTGGSIREPASFCGVVGLRPTYGSVSRYGVVAMASSLDQIGPFAKTVEDAGHIFAAISGPDVQDATVEARSPFVIPSDDSAPDHSLVIGVPKEYFIEGMEPRVAREIEIALEVFKKNGYRIKEISLPHTKYALSVYYIIVPAEVSANLGRYDGLRYGGKEVGIRDKEQKNLLETYLQNRGEGFGEEVLRRVLLGTFVLSAGYYDAYYAQAQKVRRKILNDFLNVFDSANDGVDVMFAPVVPMTAFKIGEKTSDPLAMYLSDVYTIPANLSGLPSLSIPVRNSRTYSKDALPVNFQLIGKHFCEQDLFGLGRWYEKMRG